MRKVTENAVHAFMDREAGAWGNTHCDGQRLFLHGNLIAEHGDHNGASGVFMTLAGWNTTTTRERLCGVLRVMSHNYREGVCGALTFYTRKSEPFIGENTDHDTAIGLGSDGWVFVAHPCTARGMAAVAKVDTHSLRVTS